MKKRTLLLPLSILSILAITSCNSFSSSIDISNVDKSSISSKFSSSNRSNPPSESSNNVGSSDNQGNGNETSDPSFETIDTPNAPEDSNEGAFSLSSSDGEFTEEEGLYQITKSGTYVASGRLEEGQILIEAGKNDEVVLELKGATISCSTDSPIKAVKADKVEISAKKNTVNYVKDLRNVKTVDDSSLGEGAINAKCDLKLKGTGSLVVIGNYNNGVHTTKDLDIQKETLHVTAVDNAFKGKDGISMISGNVTAISKNGNGLKTDNSDISSKGNQKGNVVISGGQLVVDSLYDGIDAAHDITIDQENEDSIDTIVSIVTGKNSSHSSNYTSVGTSAKGLKADNQILIDEGEIAIKATDDGVHANHGDTLENGDVGIGNITINGGTINVFSGDDGVHADGTLAINGGDITVDNSVEGIEATHISISGGNTHVYGVDDGVNAASKNGEYPSIEVSGGFLDVTVSTGDTDGIDSNGTFTQTGGLVISRGSHGRSHFMSTGLDVDGRCQIEGGTFISFNGVEKTPTAASGVLYAYYGSTSAPNGPGGPGGPGGPRGPGGGGPRNFLGEQILGTPDSSNIFGAGTYTLTGGDLNKTFVNKYIYSAFLIYSSELSLNTTYTLSNDGEEIISWTQSSNSTAIGQAG